MLNPRSSLRLGLTVAVTSLIAGCSAVSSSSVSSSSVSSSSASSSAAASSPSSAQVTTPPETYAATALFGSQLADVLLPATSLPSGYRADRSTSRNTRDQPPFDTAQPVPASRVCQTLTQTSFIRAAGIGIDDFAEGDYVSADRTQEIDEVIAIFTDTDAQKVMTTLWQEFGKCSSFSYKFNGTTVSNTLTRSRLPREGNDAIKAVIVSPEFEGGETIVAIRIGSQVITTLDSSVGRNLGSPAVGYAEQIAQRLRAAE